MKNPEDELLSVRQAAEAKGCTRQAIAQNIEAGRLNAVKLGRYWYVLRDEVYEAFQPTGGSHVREAAAS